MSEFSLGATPKSANAALLLFCPIFTCVVLYMTWVSTHTHPHTPTRAHTTHYTRMCLHTTPEDRETPNLHRRDSCLVRCHTLTGHMLTPSNFFIISFCADCFLEPLRVPTLSKFCSGAGGGGRGCLLCCTV